MVICITDSISCTAETSNTVNQLYSNKNYKNKKNSMRERGLFTKQKQSQT